MSSQQSFSSQPVTTNAFQYTPRYKPRCALATLAVERIFDLQLRSNDITQALGYPRKHTIAAKNRLQDVLSSPVLGLDGSFLDAYYDAQGFLEALFQVLQITPEQYGNEMATIKQTLG